MFPNQVPDKALEKAGAQHIVYTRNIFGLKGSERDPDYIFPLHWDCVLSHRPNTGEIAVRFCGDLVVYADTKFDPNAIAESLNGVSLRDIIQGEVEVHDGSIDDIFVLEIDIGRGYFIKLVIPSKERTLHGLKKRMDRRVIRETEICIRDEILVTSEVDYILAPDYFSPYRGMLQKEARGDFDFPYIITGFSLEYRHPEGLKVSISLSGDIPWAIIGVDFRYIYSTSVKVIRVVYRILALSRGYSENDLREEGWAYG